MLLICCEKNANVKTSFNKNIECERQRVRVGDDDINFFNYILEED